MRMLGLLVVALIVGCSDADRVPSASSASTRTDELASTDVAITSDVAATPQPVVLRQLAGPPIQPIVCSLDPQAALGEHLRLAGLWNNDPLAGPMSPRMANNIATHSFDSLLVAMARYKGNVVALVTHAGQEESCAWLIDSSGIVAYHSSSLGAEQIRNDVLSVIDALDVEGASAMRAPVSRSEPDANPAEGTTGLSILQPEVLTVALANVAETVVPGAISSKLMDYDSVIVVPHQWIADFPFMLLPQGRSTEPELYLIDAMSIQVAPSLAELGIGPGLHRDPQIELATLSAEVRAEALADALIVGDPLYSDAEYVMPQLPGAASEARAVARELGASFLSGEAATSDAVMARFGQRPRYMHFATHGLADFEDARNNEGFLALAHGGRLSVNDIKTTRMANGAIVVLSACQSGLGARRPGGIVGLPRAFLNAGAQTAIMSLWNVDDEATSFLMVKFMEYLLQTGSPSASFRAATLATRNEYNDPRLWASFVVFSAAQP